MTIAAGMERSILDALPITICTVDLEGRVTFMNRGWGRLARTGSATAHGDVAVAEGLTIWSLLSDMVPRDQIDRAVAQLRDGRSTTVDWEVRPDTSDEKSVQLLRIGALRDGRAISGFAVSVVDVTESQRWRESLGESSIALTQATSLDRVVAELSRQLRRALACDAVAVGLVEGHSDQLRLAHHVGFDQEPAEVESSLRATWREACASGHAVEREPAAGGIEITVPIPGGEVQGVVTVIATDPDAARRHAEIRHVVGTIASQAAGVLAQLEAARRGARRARLDALGEVAAGVAHELRNPLFGISSAAQLLRYRVREDPVVEKNLGRILREVERLNGMVESLLEYGRPAPTRLESGDPDQVWEDVLAAQRGQLESRALILRHAPAQPRAVCNIDPAKLAQLFGNVLANAAEAAPEGSDLTLTSTLLHDGSWRCQLRNGGPAIPSDALPRVFEIFYSTKPGGTGIGLALCQRIVDEHGGSISIESAPDEGTTLSIVIPRAPV